MAVTAHVYPQLDQNALTKAVNLSSDSLKVALLSSYTYSNLDTTMADILGRTVTDGVTTNASTTVTSATAAFTAKDVGKFITGTGIPAGATISSVTNGTTVVISAAATASGTTLTLNFFRGVEASGTGYTPGGQALTGVTLTTTGLVTTLTAANPSWASSTVTASYALFFDSQGSATASSALNFPICYWDFGGSQSSSAGTFTLTVNGSGLVTWTAS